MARMLIAALLGAATITPLLAQSAPVPPRAPSAPLPPTAPMPPMPPMAPRAMMPETRAEVQAHVAQMFAMHDANHDGFLTADEMQMHGPRPGMMGRHMGAGGAMGDANAAFDRLDANHDGKITRDEFGKAREIRIEKRIVMDGGAGQAGMMEAPGAPGQRREVRIVRQGGGMMGAMLLQHADANHDGRVSLAEATGAALQHFDMMDANRDGRISPDERAAGRQRMKQMRMQMHSAG